MSITTAEIVLTGLGVAASALYMTVALVLSRRQLEGPARGAQRGFIIWWGGLALLGLATAYFRLVQDYGAFGPIGARAAWYTLVGLVLVMLSGLAYYLLYLYTGRPSMRWPVALFYALLFVFFVATAEAQRPYINTSSGEPVLDYEEPFGADSPWTVILGLGLVGPPLLAAVGYMALFRRSDDRTVRYRIALVSGAFILWFGYSALNTIVTAALAIEEPSFSARLASQLLGTLAAVIVLLAYLPPGFVRRRGVHGIFDNPRFATTYPPMNPRMAPIDTERPPPGRAWGWSADRWGGGAAWPPPQS